MRIPVPEGGASLFDWQPELFATFNLFYGAPGSECGLHHPTTDVRPIRNDRVVHCALYRNLRFAGAKQQGLDESLVAQIEDDYASSALPERFKLAIEYADVLIRYPAGLGDDLRTRLAAEFTPAEIVELTATVTIASAFSKAAIAWGPPPQIPLTEAPTPGPDRGVRK